MMSGNHESQRSPQAISEFLQGMERPGGGMIDPSRCPLDVGVIHRGESLLEIVCVLPQIVPQPCAAGEARRVEKCREIFGEFGDGFRVLLKQVREAKTVLGVCQRWDSHGRNLSSRW